MMFFQSFFFRITNKHLKKVIIGFYEKVKQFGETKGDPLYNKRSRFVFLYSGRLICGSEKFLVIKTISRE